MKIQLTTVLLASSTLIFSACGKNAGRTSGQSSEIETAHVSGKQVLRLENQAGQESSVLLPGYRVLGKVETAALPSVLRNLDSGTAIGTLTFEYEVKKFDLAYPGTIGAPISSMDSVQTAYKVFLFTPPSDRSHTLIAAFENQPDAAFYRSSEPVSINFQLINRCSMVYVPRRDRDSIPDQTSPCNPATEICSIAHNNQMPESKAIWDTVRDYPGSRCVAYEPKFSQVGTRNNTRQAVQIEIELYRSLTSLEASQLQLKL